MKVIVPTRSREKGCGKGVCDAVRLVTEGFMFGALMALSTLAIREAARDDAKSQNRLPLIPKQQSKASSYLVLCFRMI